MNELFECLLKYNQHEKKGNFFVIKQLIEKLFRTTDTASDKENIMMITKLLSVDADMYFFEDEDEYDDEADLLIKSHSDLDDDKSVTLDYTQKDLTAKEVRALSTVCIMLIQSSTIGNEVDAEKISEKLYLDTQESVPRAALDFCTKLVNGPRKIRSKKDEECLGRFFGMRKLRNLIVRYAKEHYKRNRMSVCSLYPISYKKISIRMDSKSLYLLFAKSYNMHKKKIERTEITSNLFFHIFKSVFP
ncbi:uncharacterized protein EV154DRAFT_482116 [Mucor mucedo]|uniref:uncharacterized protein n=1 Tax=Mucor mucedo TaxID=29922 RepID=UPI002220D0E8|nr:uncharacterized protein EV154DRAFT_482116 [Mucor mucedo]KAI7890524.1 hypothetical protein EV154DRAFT_482116 [Mucor mucedo]